MTTIIKVQPLMRKMGGEVTRHFVEGAGRVGRATSRQGEVGDACD
jgi:hypothetical protein